MRCGCGELPNCTRAPWLHGVFAWLRYRARAERRLPVRPFHGTLADDPPPPVRTGPDHRPPAGGAIPTAPTPARARSSRSVRDRLTPASAGAVEALNAGDTGASTGARRPTAKRSCCVASTAAQPITVCGVRGPGGERPVLDGENATTRATMGHRVVATEPRGLIHVSWGAGDALGFAASPAHPACTSATPSTNMRSAPATAAPRPTGQRRRHLRRARRARRGERRGAGRQRQRIFVAWEIRGNAPRRPHRVLRALRQRHRQRDQRPPPQPYTEAVGMTIQFNRFAHARRPSGGNLLATAPPARGATTSSMARIDLVEAQESWPMVQALPEYRRSFVYATSSSRPEGPAIWCTTAATAVAMSTAADPPSPLPQGHAAFFPQHRCRAPTSPRAGAASCSTFHLQRVTRAKLVPRARRWARCRTCPDTRRAARPRARMAPHADPGATTPRHRRDFRLGKWLTNAANAPASRRGGHGSIAPAAMRWTQAWPCIPR